MKSASVTNIPISTGTTNIEINAGQQHGVFALSLLVDDKIIDSKQIFK